jgi:hypothetical protein
MKTQGAKPKTNLSCYFSLEEIKKFVVGWWELTLEPEK